MFRLRNIRAASRPLQSNLQIVPRVRLAPPSPIFCAASHLLRSLHSSATLKLTQPTPAQPSASETATDAATNPPDALSNTPNSQLNTPNRRRTLISRANLDDLGEFGEPLHSSKFLISSQDAWKNQEIEPRLRDYIHHMHECLSLNHIDRIFQIFQTMQQDRKLKSLHIEVFNLLLQACAKLKQPEAAVATFDAIFKHQLEPNFLSYQYLLNSIILHTDTHLAFDYLCVLNREMATQLRRAREANTTEVEKYDAFMQEHFINICVAFLKRTGRHLSGHPSSRLLDSVSGIEHAIVEYFDQAISERYSALGVSEMISKLNENRENNLPLLPNSLHDSLSRSPLKQSHPLAFKPIAEEEFKKLLPKWSQVRLINDALFLHHINRGNLFTAAKYWNHVEYLRALPRVSKFLQKDFSMNSNFFQMARYSHLIAGMSKLHYGLAEVDDFEQQLPKGKTSVERLQRREAKQAEYLKSIPQWHAVRNALYAEMWTYTQSIMELVRKANAGEDPSALETEHVRRMMARQPSIQPKKGLHQHSNQSHFLKRLEAHSHEAPEPIVTPSKTNPYNRNIRPKTAGAASKPSRYDAFGGDMRSIDEIVEKLSKESAALDHAHEQVRKTEQNMMDIEINAEREERRSINSVSFPASSPATSNDKGFKAQLEQAFNESADDELQTSGSDSDHVDSKRILSELKSEVAAIENQSLPAWISELDMSNSFLPPVAQPLFNSALSGRFSHLYRRMMASLLLYGASNSKRLVTAVSYRRNKELVHALYHDYMSLNLSPPDPRVLMLGHLNHAPAEFHATIISRNDDLASYGGNDLFNSLFAGVFKAKYGDVNTTWVRPNAANLTGSQLRSTSNHSADNSDATQTLIPAFSPLLHQQQLRTHFFRVWSAYHANHGWSHQEQGSDFAFRKRTFRLIEELARRGLSPQNARDPLLPLIIRSLSFTSFSSRVENEDSSEENATNMSFHRKRTTLYEAELAHLRRVLRVLFQLMLNQGVTPDSRSMHALIDGCLAHRRVTEAKIILNYMMDKLSVKPDIHTAKLFLQSHVGPQKGGKPLREIVEDVEGMLNELVAVVKPLAPQNPVGLTRSNNGSPSNQAWSSDVSSQIVAAFDSVLQRYEAAQDSGAGMLRVHEHLFALGLQPSSRTLKTSLNILVQNPNTQTFGRAKELMQRALSTMASPMEEDSHLVQLVREVHETRAKAKEEILAQQQQQQQNKVDESASTEEANVEDADQPAAAATITMKSTAIFDPLSDNHVVKLAIPFSYETWHNVTVTSHSWLVLLKAADAIGSWIDTWQLYQQFLSHLSRLPSTDSRGRLLLTNTRRQMFAVVLRSFLHNANHLEQAKQMYYYNFLHDSMACFFWFKADHSASASKQSSVTMKLFSFSLQNDDKLSQMMLPSDYRHLAHLENMFDRGVKISVPEDEIMLVETQQQLLATIKQKSQSQQKQKIKQASSATSSQQQSETTAVPSEIKANDTLAFL